MAIVIAMAPALIYIGLTSELPVLVSLFTFIPLLLMLVMLAVSLIGLHEFGKDQKLRIKPISYLILIATFIPYQILLMISAARALIRELSGNNAWEKTAHLGLHRTKSNYKQGRAS
jgi:glycosyltransferase XagB